MYFLVLDSKSWLWLFILTLCWGRCRSYLLLRRHWGRACYARGWRTARRLDTGCRTCARPATGWVLLSVRRIWLQPWSPVATTWAGHARGSAGCAPATGSCSSTSATWIATDTGNCLLERIGNMETLISLRSLQRQYTDSSVRDILHIVNRLCQRYALRVKPRF